MYQPSILTEEEGAELLEIARSTMERFVRQERVSKPENYSEKFDQVYGVMCTLTMNSRRSLGIVGLPYPLLSMLDAAMYAVMDACQDGNIKPDELAEIKIGLSLITEPKRIEFRENSGLLRNIMPATDGLMLRYGIYESFLMPQEWENIKEKESFLGALCIKAGLDRDTWKDSDIQIYKFQSQIFSG